jgi:hypothetical protein
MQLVPTTQLLVTQCTTTIPSSVASTAYKVHYLVDDIDRPVACSLVIRYGINNHRTREVAVGLAIPRRKYHGSNIPEDYCKVEVSTVIQGYEDNMLDISGPEGIEKLGHAIKNFILWSRRDIQLSEPPPSSQAPPLTQDSSAPADPLPNPPSSPIVAPIDPHHLCHHSILHLLHHPKILNKHGRHQSSRGRNF